MVPMTAPAPTPLVHLTPIFDALYKETILQDPSPLNDPLQIAHRHYSPPSYDLRGAWIDVETRFRALNKRQRHQLELDWYQADSEGTHAR